MIYDIVYESCPWHTRVALMDSSGRILSLHYDDVDNQLIEGVVVLGRVRSVNEALGAAFVDIGDVEDGFLHLNTLTKDHPMLTQGSEIMVRVTRSRREGKGARLSARVLSSKPADAKAPCIVKKADSALTRALMDSGTHPVRVWILDARTRTNVISSIPETKLFQLDQHEDVDLIESLDEQLDGLSTNTFEANGGVRLTVEATKALTSVDVDSGSFVPSRKETVTKEINIRAAEEFVRLCRFLDLGGNIIVDFVTPKKDAERKQIKDIVETLFAETDMRKVEVMSMSRFGIMEINRERTGEDLLHLVKWPLYVAGDILLKMWREKPGQQSFVVECAPEVAEILRKRLTNAACLAYIGRPVEIKEATNLSVDRYKISTQAA